MRKSKRRLTINTSDKRDGTIYFFDRFSHPKFFSLSALYPCKFYLDDDWWKSVIHYYHAHKCNDHLSLEYLKIRDCSSSDEAKILGSKIATNQDWVMNKYNIMLDATEAKFFQNRHCRNVLLSTGIEKIVELSPYDTYWGGKNGGQNKMGQILIEVRNKIRKKMRIV